MDPSQPVTTYSTTSAPTGHPTVQTTSAQVILTGARNASTVNASSHSVTAEPAKPTATLPSVIRNTQPCNGYTEFCTRSYSNITMVAAHNSPFVRPHSLAANQALPLPFQLRDGIRMLQFESHYYKDDIYLCHTSCHLLNAGTLESYLTEVAQWLHTHPYEVITILMVNSDFIDPSNYVAPVVKSGLIKYTYTPPKNPMVLSDWPTLSEMIVNNQRAVVFLDYDANETKIPWLLEEFTQMWETPFSPTNRSFPCTEQRPPKLAEDTARDKYLYLANHNLNIGVTIDGQRILVPEVALLNETNAASGFGSLGRMADQCVAEWGRPPNFLLVDYYNYGEPNGSVFEVAAQMNGVVYRESCCGSPSSIASITLPSLTGLVWIILIFATGMPSFF